MRVSEYDFRATDNLKGQKGQKIDEKDLKGNLVPCIIRLASTSSKNSKEAVFIK